MSAEFYRRGTSKVYYLTTVPSNPSSPTTVEIAAGIDLSPQLNAIDGFAYKTTFIDVENLASRNTPQISGTTKAEGGSLTFNEKKNPSSVTPSSYDTIMDGLDVDDDGALVFMPYGVTSGNDCEVWPVTIGSFSRKWDMGNTTAKYMVEFAATGAPTQHGTIGLYPTSLDVSPSTATVDVSDATAKKLTATVTLSDSSTVDVSTSATWTSSDTGKATVAPGGWVLAVAAGSATVTASYTAGGVTVTDTCAVTSQA